jgi:hypothetical protein
VRSSLQALLQALLRWQSTNRDISRKQQGRKALPPKLQFAVERRTSRLREESVRGARLALLRANPPLLIAGGQGMLRLFPRGRVG